MVPKTMSVVIDGPAGVGKSTIAKSIARILGFAYIDTGAMYRAITLFALEQGIPIAEENTDAMLELVRKEDFQFIFVDDRLHVFFGQRDITAAIRSHQVTENVSYVAALPAIREELRDIQRRMAASIDVVMEGRDIGTVVLPNADYKFFLTASVDVRAQRRFSQLYSQGVPADLKEIRTSIEKRDCLDSSRAHSPLRKADDAIEIDTSFLSVPEVIEVILSYIKVVLSKAQK